MNITIDSEKDTPIYQQIVEAIQEEIRAGRALPGDKLPTVRELASQMKLARGTIKRAYDELESLGAIQMQQGKGTFVMEKQRDVLGHKERAMIAIDRLLDEMESLSFSPREVEIFFHLKLRARLERNSSLRVAVVHSNPESLAVVTEQLSHLENVDTYPFLLSDILGAPSRLEDNMDLIIAPSNHCEALEAVVRDMGKVIKVVLSPTQTTMMELAKLNEQQSIGVMAASEDFGQLMEESARALGRSPMELRLLGKTESLESFLRDKDAVLVPQNYVRFASQQEQADLRAFGRQRILIPFAYQIDGGSYMYLEERIQHAQALKRGQIK